jgi:hypothetical protein
MEGSLSAERQWGFFFGGVVFERKKDERERRREKGGRKESKSGVQTGHECSLSKHNFHFLQGSEAVEELERPPEKRAGT